MPKITIEIYSCRECPHSYVHNGLYYEGRGYAKFCEHPTFGNNHEPIKSMLDLPKWCPLLKDVE